MFVTRHNSVTDPHLRERLWRLYELAFRPIAELAVCREMMYRHEFEQLVADPVNRTWVLWQDEAPVAMTVITTDINTTHYLSKQFFERTYPDHVLRNAIHYVLFVVVHPAYEAKGALVKLSRESFGLEADEGNLVVFDTPSVNQPAERGGMSELVGRLAQMVSPGVEARLVDVQRFYAIDFEPGARHRRMLADRAEGSEAESVR